MFPSFPVLGTISKSFALDPINRRLFYDVGTLDNIGVIALDTMRYTMFHRGDGLGEPIRNVQVLPDLK